MNLVVILCLTFRGTIGLFVILCTSFIFPPADCLGVHIFNIHTDICREFVLFWFCFFCLFVFNDCFSVRVK